MAFNVNQFRAEMSLDGARPNLFEVIMPFPQIAIVNGAGATAARLDSSAQSRFTFMCRSAQLPGSTVGVAPVNYFGREIKLPGNATFPEWTVTVYNDEDFGIRNAFEKWMNAFNTHRDNLRSPSALSAAQYSVDPIVKQWGKTGQNVLKTYKFIGLFPIDVSPIDLDWGQNDTVEEFSVTFAYQWWEDVKGGIV